MDSQQLQQAILEHQRNLSACGRCAQMIEPVILGSPIASTLCQWAGTGIREGQYGKPFAWTAGKTLFKWFEHIGVSEELYRQRVYMAAVCRTLGNSTYIRLDTVGLTFRFFRSKKSGHQVRF